MSSAVDNLSNAMASASINDSTTAADDKVAASAAEGRRLYIGNLAYATTEAELQNFFTGFDMLVPNTLTSIPPFPPSSSTPHSHLEHHDDSSPLWKHLLTSRLPQRICLHPR